MQKGPKERLVNDGIVPVCTAKSWRWFFGGILNVVPASVVWIPDAKKHVGTMRPHHIS